jgi:hypothetical protein
MTESSAVTPLSFGSQRLSGKKTRPPFCSPSTLRRSTRFRMMGTKRYTAIRSTAQLLAEALIYAYAATLMITTKAMLFRMGVTDCPKIQRDALRL